MKAELEERDIQLIAEAVVAMLRPHLNGHGKPQEEVMDAHGLASYLKVELSWIRQNWKAQGIPAVKLGNQLRFRRSEIDRWLNAQETR